MSSCCQGVDQMFGEQTAEHDLRRYRKRGPSKPTRMLLAALRAEGIERASVLDIGGGIGAIQQELLHAGADRATCVEASAAYLRAARAEAARQGDFVALAEQIEPADVVTLDRVICCYPDMEALVGASADRSRRLYGLVYPRDAWWVRLAVRAFNLGLRVGRRVFRVHVHRTAAVDAVARRQGLTPSFHRHAGPIWQVAVYVRELPEETRT
jgi:2-polyprenyl-3-methyl-5-hydroxy-6-metoxy-1,4-benzoquinol methylase